MKITKNCLKTISYKTSPQRTALAVATALACASPSWSNPTGGQVVGGSATISTPSASSMVIDQTSNKAIINWNTFSIGAGESVRFNQPSASSIALNRVLGNTRSEIFGSLTANGQIFLVNPNGVLMARGAEVSAAGFLASSLGITDGDFLAGRYNFTRGAIAGTVINEGNILTPGGYTALLAPNIVNNGLISARLGSVALAAGDRVTLDFNGDGLLRVAVDEATLSAAIKNSGTITADGGQVILTSKSANALLDTVLNNEGVIRADTLVDRNGVIALESSAGITNNSGSLLARGLNAGERGGDISIAAPGINLQSTGVANASGAAGGGNVRIKSSGLVQANGVIEARGGTGAGGGVSIQSDVLVQTGGIDAASASDAGGNVNIQTRNLLSAGAINANGAAGGSIDIQASNSIIQTASAQLTASGTAGNGGHITLQAAKGLFSSGTMQATGAGDDGAGGAIKVLGSQIVLQGATLDASGDAGGGSVLVGGDFQGKNTAVPNAQSTSVNFASTFAANANNTGDGGKVVVWSNEQTTFYGKVSARGGAQSGDGGAIEVSGKENLTFGGQADAGAPHGKAGTLLLDPKNITIDSAAPSFSVIDLVDPNISAGEGFANSVVALSSGNIVATNANDNFVASKSGAVYLFNGKTGALISSLNGSSPNDLVGLDGVTVLTNGNYVVRSPSWNNGAATVAGAVTFGSGATGISGNVSNANSLVGTTTNDRVGSGGVTALTNGNYVVNSSFWDNGAATNAGAVTFGSGVTGISGNVSNANSLVGTTSADRVGVGGITALANGNYVVSSSQWNNGAATNAGAVTFGSGTTGISGNVSNANSLVGVTTVDSVGGGGVTALNNGNYVVSSPGWNNVTATQAGAVTFGSGTTGISGVVSNANSLVGATTNDRVGVNGVTALTNGNYVVNSFFWNNGAATSAGAVTFGSGTTGISGVVSNANSLVGATTNDRVGFGGVTVLTNGNYVVRSQSWNNGAATAAGAVTFGSGTTGISGNVSNANSLVGTSTADQVGFGGITALTNGNYVVSSPNWNNGAATSAGAVTFGSGVTGISGNVSNANSLVGTTTNDQVGIGGITALTNGNYVVNSKLWNNGAATLAGAVTFGSGITGISGNVSNANSLVGTTNADQVGVGGITALTNGNYVVSSTFWRNAGVVNAGAVTFGSGTTGISGNVSNANSLVGTTTNDFVGLDGATALTNGNYVVNSRLWNNGSATQAGAMTFGSGTTGISGNVSNANSLVGTTANDQVGSGGVTALGNGNYVVRSPIWNNGATTKAGAVTFGSGITGISGNVSNVNSLIGTTIDDQVGSGGITALTVGNYVVNSPLYDNAGKVDSGKVVLVSTDVTNPLTFGNNAAAGVTISPSRITAITNTGTAVVLQANNDIVLNAASNIVTAPAGVANGGNLTLQAGRSVQLQSNITSANGNVTIVANETAANGVIDAQRDPGTASISMSPGATINAGSGTISLKLADGAGLTNNASGDIQLGSLKTTASISLINSGSGGALTQSGGITAGTLTLSTNNGAVTLQNSGNAIANLGTSALGTGALNLKTGGALTVTGAVGATGGITLESAGPLSINQALNAGAGNVSLTSSGGGTSTISQTAGVITANTLNVTTAGASADFTQANQITNLGAVSLGAAVFTLNNATGLTVNGQLTSVGANLTTAGPLTIANKIDTGSGSISLITTGVGPITQTGSGALVAVGGKLTVTTANSDVTLIPQGAAVNNVTELKSTNTGAGNFSYTGNGAEATLFVSGGNVGSLTVTNNNGISMTGEINTAKDAAVRSVNKNVGANQVLMTSTAGGISIRANEGIDLEGQLKAADATNGNITLISDTKSITRATGFVTGNTFTVQAGPGQAQSLVFLVSDTVNNKIAAKNVALVADTLQFADFNGFTGTGTLSVAPRTAGNPMDIGTVGAATAGALTLDQNALNTMTSFGTINFGQTGALALPASTNTAGVINVGSSIITNANLNLFSNGADNSKNTITQSGALVLGAGTGKLGVVTAGGNVNLLNVGNTLGTLGLVSTGNGTFNLNDAAGLTVSGPVSATGIAITITGGDLQIKGAITDAGNSFLSNTTGSIVQTAPAPITNNDLTINAAKAITLTDPTNNLKGEVKITNSGANNVAITNSGGLVLGTSNVGSGTLTIAALGGPITQSSSSIGFTQAANAVGATFNAGANAITLDKKTGNVFTGPVTLTGSDVTIATSQKLKVSLVNVTGKATVTGDLDIEGNVGGDLIVDALGGATNFGTPTGLNTTVGGNLSLTNTDTVTQSAGKSLQVTLTTLIDASKSNANITLNEPANHFAGNATFKGGAIQITDNGSLNATLAATGASTLNAAKNLTVTGSSKSLTANNTTVPFTVAVAALAVTNGDLNITSAGQTVIGDGTTNVNGNVTITSADSVSQTGGSQLIIGGGQLNVSGAGGASINAGFTRPNNTIGTLGEISLGQGTFTLNNLGALSIAGKVQKAGGGYTIVNDGQITHQVGSGAIDTTKATSGAATDGNISLTTLATFGTKDILLNNDLNAAGGNVTLQATGNITQSTVGSKITANAVAANAGNTRVSLDGVTNAFNVITGTSTQGFSATNTLATTVGTGGITETNNNVTLLSGGTLTLTGPVSAGPFGGTVNLKSSTGSIVGSAAGVISGTNAVLQAFNNVDMYCPGAVCTGNSIGNNFFQGSVAGTATNGFFALDNNKGLDITTLGGIAGITAAGATLLRLKNGDLTQQATGLITSSGLAFEVLNGNATLNAANNVTGNVAGFAQQATNSINFRNTGAFNVGTVTVGVTGGPAVDAGLTTDTGLPSAVTLKSDTGAITQSGGAGESIRTNTLNVTTTNQNATLGNSLNTITNVGAVALGTGKFTLANTGNLTVTGTVDATGGIVLSNAGTLSIENNLNAGVGNVSLNTTGANNSISSKGSVITADTLTLSTGANASVSLGDGFFTPAQNVTNLGLSTIGGNLTLLDNGGLTITGPVTADSVSITTSGKLTQNAGSAIVTSGVVGISLTTNGAGASAIQLNDNLNAGTNSIFLSATGSITQAAGALGTSAVVGVTSNGGATLNQANTVGTFSGTNTGSGDIIFTNTAASLDLSNVSNSGGGNIAINNTGALRTINAPTTTTANGNISLTSSGTQTIIQSVTAGGSGAVTLTANGAASDITIFNAISSTSGALNLTAGRAINANGNPLSTAGLLTTNSTAGQNLSGNNTVGSFNATNTAAGAITLTNTAAPLTVTGISNAGGGKITVTNNGGLTTTGAVSNTGGGNVALNATGGALAVNGILSAGTGDITLTTTGAGNAITQSQPITGIGLTATTAGSVITLANTNNDLTGTATLTGSTVQLTDATALTAVLNTTGPTALIAGANGLAGGNLTVFGTTTGVGSNLTTTTAAGSAGATTFGTMTVGGNLLTTSAGAVSQTGALVVSGTSNINAGGNAITLTNTSNDFKGAVTLTGGTVQVTDANALSAILATTGPTTLIAGKNGAAGGNLVVSGTATGAGANLNTTTTPGTGGTTTFGTTAVGGTLISNSAGDVTQTGPLTVTGTSTVTATGKLVTLTNVNNDFQSLVTLTGSNIEVVDKNKLAVSVTSTGFSKITGDLDVDANTGTDLTITSGGNIQFGVNAPVVVGGNLTATAKDVVTQVNQITVTGTTLIDASANDKSITLINAANHFTGTADFRGSAIQVRDNGALSTTLQATGASSLTAAGDLTVSGFAANLTTITTGTGKTIFGAPVTNITGNVSVTSAGNVSQTGQLIVGGTLDISGGGGNPSVTLNAANNTISNLGTVTIGTGAVSLTNLPGLTVTGVVGATSGITLNAGGPLILNNALNAGGGNVSLTTTGGAASTITQNATGAITANTLSLTTADANATLNTATNAITNLGTVALGTGALNLLDAGGLTVTGAVGASGGITLNTSGTLAINETLNAGTTSGVVSLTTTGAGNGITQTRAITAGTLQLTTTDGTVAFGGLANAITNLGATALGAGLLILNDAGGITVNGPVAAGGGVTLVNSGDIAVNSSINTGVGNLALLTTNGAGKSITQSAGATLTAGSLTLSTNDGDATLNSATNAITNLNTTSLGTGALNLLDAGGLTVIGAVNATGGVTLNTSGALAVNNTLNAGAGNALLTTSGAGNAITQNATGVITAGGLSLNTNNSNATLNTVSNAITNLRAVALGSGALNLLNAGGLTVTNPVGATGGITLNTSGALAVNDTLNAGGGNVSLTTTGAGNAITQSVTGVITGNTLTLSTNAADVTLDTATNAITNLGGGALGAGALKLADAGGLTVSGFTVADNGITITTSGPLAIKAPLSTNVLGDMSLTTTGAGNPAITQTAAGIITANGLSLTTANGNAALNTVTNTVGKLGNVSLGTGAFSLLDGIGLIVPTTSTVVAGGGIDLKANALTLSGTLNASAGNVALTSTTPGFGVTQTAGTITGNTLTVSTPNASATLAQSTNAITNLGASALGSGALTLFDTGGLTVTGPVSASSGITLNTSGALVINSTLASGAGNVSLTSTGAGNTITQSAAGAITGNNLSATAAGNAITLTNANNDLTGTATLTGSTVQLTDATALTAVLSATGPTTLIAGANGGAGGNLSVSGTTTGAGANLTTTTTAGSAGTTTFGTTTVGGNLLTNSAGAVSQTAATTLTVTGTSNINAGGNAITLTNTTNDFKGAVTLTGGTVQLTDANALSAILATTGPTTLIAGKNGAAGGDLVVSGATTGAGANLTTTTFGTAGTTSFGVTNVGGNLVTTSTGSVTQTGALTVNGTADINAGANDITLNLGNDFVFSAGTSKFTGKNVVINDITQLDALLTATGTANLTANGNMVVAGSAAGLTTTTTAGATPGKTTYGPTAVTGNLSATSAGAVSQTGALTVTGASTITAGANPITLTAGNDFTGAVSLNNSGANAVAITDNNALILGASALGTATTTVTAGGAITQTGALTGGGTLVTSSVGGTTLNGANVMGGFNAANTGGGVITFNNTAAPLSVTSISQTGGGATTITNAGSINTTGAISSDGDITLSATGATADINVLANITGTAANAKTLTLRADRDVVIGNGSTALNITANTAALNIDLNADRNADAQGMAFFNSATSGANVAINVTTKGGFLNAHGGNGAGGASDTTRAFGYSEAGGSANPELNRRSGVSVGTGTVINTGAGAVTLYGQGMGAVAGAQQSHNGVGVNGSIITSGGNVTLDGIGGAQSNGTVSSFGVIVSNGTIDTSAGAGTITLTGIGGSITGTGTGNSAGVSIANQAGGGTGSTVIAGSGGVVISGSGGTNSGAGVQSSAQGVFISGGTNPTSSTVRTINGGAINITGTGGTSVAATSFNVSGVQLGRGNTANPPIEFGTVTTDTGVITISGSGGSTPNVAATFGSGFGPGVNVLNGSSISTSGAGSVNITGTGGTGNSAVRYAGIFTTSDQTGPSPNNTIGGAATTSVTLTGAANTGVNTNFTNVTAAAGAGTITIDATGGATGGGATTKFTGNALRVLASGSTTLSNVTNDVATVAANITGPASTFSYTDANSVAVGTVGVTSGVTTNSGNVTLASIAGTSLGANVNAAGGAVTFIDAVSVTSPVTVTGNAGVTFSKTVNGPSTLTVNSTGTTTFTGAVGGVTKLTSLTTNAGGATVINGGAVTTTGAQTYGDPLTLNAPTSLTSTGSGNITVNGANGANPLTVNTAGVTTLGGPYTNTTITTDQPGSIVLNMGAGSSAAFTIGEQIISGTTSILGTLTFPNAITLNGDTSLTATNVAFGSTVNSDAIAPRALSIFGPASFASTVGAASPLASLAVTGAATLGGNVTTSGAAGQTYVGVVSAGALTLNAGTGPITATNAANDFTGALGLTGGTVQVIDKNALTLGTLATGNLTVTSTGALNLGQGTISGALSATSNGGAISQTGALAVTGTSAVNAGANTITLANAGNDFKGAVALINSGANAVAITDVNALILGASSVGSSTLTVNTGGPITQSGAITQAAGAGAATFNAGANAITLTSAGNDFTGTVSLGNSGANNAAITDANALVLGTSNLGSGTLGITAGGAITQTGAITQAPNGGAVIISAGANPITLTNAANDFTGAVTLANSGANNAAITDVNGLTLTATTVGAKLDVTAGAPGITLTGNVTSGGAQTYTGGVTLGANVTLNAGAANAISLGVVTGAGNNLTTTGLASITSTSSNLGALTANQTLTTGGAIGASSVAVTGTSTLGGNVTTTGAAGQTFAGATTGNNITLNAATGPITAINAANDFTGTLGLTGGTVQVTDTNALTTVLNSSGTSTLNAGGNLALSGAAAGLTTTTTGTGTTSFGTTTVSGNLASTSAGAISQTGALAVTGTSNINAGANAITLTNGGNDFTGTLTLTGGTVQVTDTNALTAVLNSSGASTMNAGANLTVSGATAGLTTTTTGTGTTSFGATTVNGNLASTSAGAISQTGALAVTGTSNINTGANAITLTNGGNDFTGTLTLTGGTVQVTDTNALTAVLNTSGASTMNAGSNLALSGAAAGLTTTTTGTGTTSFGATTVSGNLASTSAGAISQTGALAVTGTSNINAGANAITLTNGGNDFTGTLTLTGGTVQVTDTNALTAVLNTSGASTMNAGANLAVSGAAAGLTTTTTGTGTTSFGITTVNGNLASTSAGAVSQTGALAVTGTSNFNAGANAITLNNGANDFSGTLTLTGGTVQVTDTNALTAVLNTSGASTLNAGGNLALSGAAAGLTTTTTGTGTTSFGATTVNGNLATTSAGAVSQTGALAVTGTSNFNAGANAITLNNGANDFSGTLTLIGGTVQVTDTNALTAVLNTSGASTMNAGGNLALSGAAAGLTTTTTGTGTTSFGITTVNGNLASTSAGAVSQTGALAVTGTSNFNAGANAITLNNGANDFSGTLTLTGGTVQVTDTNALTAVLNTSGASTMNAGANLAVSGATAGLTTTTTGTGTTSFGATTVNGNLATTSAGAISQTGALSVTGTTNINAGANAITLTNAANDFTGAVSLNNSGANNAAITDTNALILGASTVGSGALNVTAGGAITQTGAVIQAPNGGAVAISAGANPITLTNAANDFTGTVTATGGNVSLADANAVTAVVNSTGTNVINGGGPLNVSGTLTNLSSTATSAGGSITATSSAPTFTVTGLATNNGAVNLTSNNLIIAGNGALGTGVLTSNGAAQTLQSGAITAGGYTLATGSMTLTGGAMTLTGPLTVSPATLLTGGATVVNGPTANVSGTFNLGGTASTTLTNTNVLAGGLLTGVGTLNGNVNNSGTVAPGNSPGILNIVGNFTQTAAGMLNIEIGGTTVGAGYDRIAVTGNAVLDGTMNVLQFGGYLPAQPERFQVITTTGTDTGAFATVNRAPFAAFTALAVNYQSTFTELFFPIAQVLVPPDVIVGATAAPAGTATPLFITSDRGPACLVGDVELLFYPKGAPIVVPK